MDALSLKGVPIQPTILKLLDHMLWCFIINRDHLDQIGHWIYASEYIEKDLSSL